MSVAFRELDGSPTEQYDEAGFTARREFLIAWEDRDAFALEVLGEAARHGGGIWAHYPGKTSVFAATVRYEPLESDTPDSQAIAELTEGLNSYDDSFAKAVVEYKTVSPRDRDDGPENEPGTYLTYQMRCATGYHVLGSDGWSWIDNSSPIPYYLELFKRIPMAEHHLTWHQVVDPPWDTIHGLQGTLNESEFLGCPAGTLLFEGAVADKLYRAGQEDGLPPICWQIRYVFRERSVKYGGNVYGWNHFYRELPTGWVEITNGSQKLYDSTDFLPLFQSGTSD
jgi:hypothetical protein